MAAKAAANRSFGKVVMGFSFRRAKCPLVCHKKGAAAEAVRGNRLLPRWGWGIAGSAFDAETRRGGERRGEETGGMEGGGFAGSARWGAEEAEKEEAREDRLLTRWGWGITGSAFDAETRRGGERRGEETGGMGGRGTGSVRWRAEEAESEEEDVRASLGWQAEACPTNAAQSPENGQTPGRFVTQSLGGGGGSGVGARSLSASGCGDGGRFR